MYFKEGSGFIPSQQWRQHGAKELLKLLPQLRKAAEANCVAGSPCLEPHNVRSVAVGCLPWRAADRVWNHLKRKKCVAVNKVSNSSIGKRISVSLRTVWST